jgi:hypothetical protein
LLLIFPLFFRPRAKKHKKAHRIQKKTKLERWKKCHHDEVERLWGVL